MFNTKFPRRCALAAGALLSVSAASPSLASASNGAPPVARGAGVAAAESPIVRPTTYCVTEAINSRIPRTFCKTKKEWRDVGVELDGEV